jgi:23S rRNA pseudouridine1911/1915/1917 synthase
MSGEPEKEETVVTFEVPPGYAEAARLDVYLTRFLPNATRAKVQRGIREGRVSVGESVITKPSHIVQAGDRIVCHILRTPPLAVEPEAIPLDVVYEDAHLIVLDKPAGMVVHPAYGNRTGTLVNALLYHVGGGTITLDDDADEAALDDEDVGLSTVNAAPRFPADVAVRPGIVHRLDKDTTGLMVVAKDDVTHVGLARQFEARTIQRRYLALAWGVPDPAAGRIDAAVGRDPRDRKRMAVVPPEKGKHAVTHYETVEALAFTSLLQFRLETGRTHQIRVHARHIGHPLLGDATYGGQGIGAGPNTTRRRALFANLFSSLRRQALHAHTLGFVHPRTREVLHFTADLPADMQYVLDRLRAVEGHQAGA